MRCIQHLVSNSSFLGESFWKGFIAWALDETVNCAVMEEEEWEEELTLADDSVVQSPSAPTAPSPPTAKSVLPAASPPTRETVPSVPPRALKPAATSRVQPASASPRRAAEVPLVASGSSDSDAEGDTAIGRGDSGAGDSDQAPPSCDPDIAFAGWLKQKARTSVVRGMKSWTRLYCILYKSTAAPTASPQRLACYDTMMESMFGDIPLHERMSVDLSCVRSVQASTAAKHAGCRFDVVIDEFSSATSSWSSRYPAAQACFSLEPHEQACFSMGERTLSFKAPSLQQCKVWVQALSEACSKVNDVREAENPT